MPVGYHTFVSNGPRKSGWLRLRYQTERIWKGQHFRVSLSTFTRQILWNSLKPIYSILLHDWWEMSNGAFRTLRLFSSPSKIYQFHLFQWYLVLICDDLYQATMGGTCWGYTTAGFEAGTGPKGGAVETVIQVVRDFIHLWWLMISMIFFHDLDWWFGWIDLDLVILSWSSTILDLLVPASCLIEILIPGLDVLLCSSSFEECPNSCFIQRADTTDTTEKYPWYTSKCCFPFFRMTQFL